MSRLHPTIKGPLKVETVGKCVFKVEVEFKHGVFLVEVTSLLFYSATK